MSWIKMDILEAASFKMRLLLMAADLIQIHKFYSLFLVINAFTGCCLLLYSLYYYINQIDNFAADVYNLIMILDVILATVIRYSFPVKLQKLINDSYCTYEYPGKIMEEKRKEVIDNKAKIFKKNFDRIVYFSCFSFTNLTLYGLIEGIVNGQNPYLLFPCWLPFSLDNMILHVAVIFWQAILIANTQFMAFGGLGILYIPYEHIKAEMILLKFALQKLTERSEEMARERGAFRKDREKKVDELLVFNSYMRCMRSCAEHHAEIMQYFNAVSKILMIVYSIAFGTGILSCTFSGYLIVSDNEGVKVKFIGLAMVLLLHLFVIFWIGDSTTNELLSLGSTIYALEWYHLPKECQSTLKLMLLKANRPLYYSLILGQRVDMEAYMSLVKASYYYINMMTAT